MSALDEKREREKGGDKPRGFGSIKEDQTSIRRSEKRIIRQTTFGMNEGIIQSERGGAGGGVDFDGERLCLDRCDLLLFFEGGGEPGGEGGSAGSELAGEDDFEFLDRHDWCGWVCG